MGNDFGGRSFAPAAPPVDDEKTFALITNILGAVTLWLGPLIIWAIKKEQSKFLAYQALQTTIWGGVILGCYIVLSILSLLPFVGCVFCLLYPVILVFQIGFPIIAITKNNAGMLYEYPLIGNLVKYEGQPAAPASNDVPPASPPTE